MESLLDFIQRDRGSGPLRSGDLMGVIYESRGVQPRHIRHTYLFHSTGHTRLSARSRARQIVTSLQNGRLFWRLSFETGAEQRSSCALSALC